MPPAGNKKNMSINFAYPNILKTYFPLFIESLPFLFSYPCFELSLIQLFSYLLNQKLFAKQHLEQNLIHSILKVEKPLITYVKKKFLNKSLYYASRRDKKKGLK